MMNDDSSSSQVKSGSSVSKLPAQPELSIVCWPLRDSPAGILGLAGIAAVAFGVYWLTGQPWMSIFVLLVLLSCTWRLWLPVQFDFSSVAITRRFLGRSQQIPWYLVERVERCKDGIRLYPRSDNALLNVLHIYSPDDAESLHELADRLEARR